MSSVQMQYPPAQGMYTPAYLPAVVSATRSPHWTYSPKALATHGDQRPYRPDDVTRGHVLELLTKETFIKQMEEVNLLRDATPNDMQEARTTTDPHRLEYVCNFGRPDRIKIFLHLFYLYRLRAEPGKLSEIYERWKQEYTLRDSAVRLREVAWECDRNVVQNLERCFIRDCKKVQYAGLIKEKDWLDLEKHSLIVLRSFLNDMAVADNGLIQIRTLEETNKSNEAKAESRRQALADAQAKQEALQLAREEAKREAEAEAKRKAELEEKEREEAQAARDVQTQTAVLTVQAKIAAYQGFIAQLTADFAAGKITSAEFSEKMATASQLLA
ncbi:uncharacterized protein ACA1_052570 [Acanthamoeba castellanii str. Neff]|uniref:Uncharacterized protein n=1 Tax=Acanthamoeba castellanii (strain ATCC 30010 / Neff) TaxID=1257118 RepID=L8H7X2_ACACF|nr:uncharacterized protein ACA1_052570 [Acanthamoeba castellanii str. Neff]ELR20566.1 hypothetical protein ACA1_052570 [Acanthamoeba castellanii str. Neff]